MQEGKRFRLHVQASRSALQAASRDASPTLSQKSRSPRVVPTYNNLVNHHLPHLYRLLTLLYTFFHREKHTVFSNLESSTVTNMSGLDVEALLDAAAKAPDSKDQNGTGSNDDHDLFSKRDRDSDDRRSRDDGRLRDSVDRDSDRYDGRGGHRWSPDGPQRSPRSRDGGRGRRSRDGDYYRAGRGGRSRSRSRSPYGRYRPRDDRRRDRRDRDDRRDRGPRDSPRPHPKGDEPPAPTEDERDKRTVFVQQLAARLRTKQLKEFFEKVGPVNEAQIVKDRISQRSKG